MTLQGKNILITGGGVRLGRQMALALARAGANILLHYGKSTSEAQDTAAVIQSMGRQAWLIQADLSNMEASVSLVEKARKQGPIFAVINNASIFEPLRLADVDPDNWQRHLDINLSAPFFICQSFFNGLGPDEKGRIVNMLDWRALRPGVDHLPYTISKAALEALTRTLARSMAPRVVVNGIALGAVLPPVDGSPTDRIIEPVPMKRWAQLEELDQTILFLMDGPEYITGEIIHLDGGRHLV
ncbi:MAG: SDR family oxidoreductase [Leptolinea sp.]|jgi:NAD(P)-dependent dehydrogenase (short-subunit alcohol dehydrogenase family)|nr:SDR family oxidoreductase [Leptolinea sp.]